MRVLVTGASGFVGRHVVEELLSSNHEVYACARREAPAEWRARNNLRYIRCDLETDDIAGLIGAVAIDAAVHLAADLGRKGAMRHNLQLTEKFLAAVERLNVPKLIGVSSLAVYDLTDAAPLTLIDETAACGAGPSPSLSEYGFMKYRQELLFREFQSRSNRACMILRPGLVYDRETLPSAHAGLRLGPIAVLSRHDGEVPLIEARSLARAISRAVSLPHRGADPVNLVDDNLPAQQAYVEAVKQRWSGVALSAPWRRLCWSLRAVFQLARLTGLRAYMPDVFAPQSFSLRFKPFRFTNARAKAVLGWRPNADFSVSGQRPDMRAQIGSDRV